MATQNDDLEIFPSNPILIKNKAEVPKEICSFASAFLSPRIECIIKYGVIRESRRSLSIIDNLLSSDTTLTLKLNFAVFFKNHHSCNDNNQTLSPSNTLSNDETLENFAVFFRKRHGSKYDSRMSRPSNTL